jgi:hypothetical protein
MPLSVWFHFFIELLADREINFRALEEHVVDELAPAAAGMVVRGQPAIAELRRTPNGEVPVVSGSFFFT